MTSDALVYVVEDDEAVRRALARLIRSVGLSVETFPSAKAFLEHPLLDRPACLVLDVRLPGPSGLELQTALGEAQRAMPIIFITGHGNVPMSVRAMKSGALDFLQKPFNDQELLEAVQRALGRSREARAENADRTAIQHRFDTLTRREREVLSLVVTGMLNKQIAARLGAAEKTIKVHRGRVMRKMAADSVADLVRMTQRLEQTRRIRPKPHSEPIARGLEFSGPRAWGHREQGRAGIVFTKTRLDCAPGQRQGRPSVVCVIDDDASVLRALQRLLGADGFVVKVFSSAEDFLESEQGKSADCLVLDVHLGGLSGFDLQDRLVASGARIPVVFITAHDDASTRERARRSGAVEYLRKPFDDESLIGAIHKALGHA